MPSELEAVFATIRRGWGWFLAFGLVLVVLGAFAIVYPLVATLTTMVFLGWLLFASGLMQILMAARVRGWSGFFLHVLGGVLETIVGLLVLKTPGEAALVVTLLLAVYLLVGGLYRLIAAFTMGFEGAGWVALGGLVSALLGLALVLEWPVSAVWFIGTCVGVDLILHGTSWIAFALAARRTPPAAQSGGPGPV